MLIVLDMMEVGMVEGEEVECLSHARFRIDPAKEVAPLSLKVDSVRLRPEALPQISALALRAGCALILKSGSEAKESNAALYRVIRDAVVAAAPARAKRALAAAVTLLPGRDAVAKLLKATDESPAPLVDLVVPRGSNDLVKHVQKSTKVPVLGHADGVCHVYVDASADVSKVRARARKRLIHSYFNVSV